MGSFWPFVLGLVLSMAAVAQESSSEFSFRGQATEAVGLERTLTETRTRTEMRDSTCTRQVPYQDRECGYETRYRQECSWVPPREECGRRDERRCRDVTRYRQECTNGPDRRVCDNIPGERVCTNRPDREICEDRSGEEECREVNGRRVCRRTGGRQCRTVPGERVCHDRPDRTVCRDVPGERHCRQVSYPDQECTTQSVPWCHTIPGQNVCRDIPYEEHVCRNVTRYRTETYACKEPVEVPYEVTFNLSGELEVQFVNPDFRTEVPFTANLTEARTFTLTPSAVEGVLVGIRPGVPQMTNDAQNIILKQKMEVMFTDAEALQQELTKNISAVVIDFTAKKLSFTAQGEVELEDSVEVILEGRKKRLFSTVVGKSQVSGDLRSLNATILPQSDNVTAVQIDLSKVDLSALSDKKTFKMKFKHMKGLPTGFGWTGAIPELKADSEAAADVVR